MHAGGRRRSPNGPLFQADRMDRKDYQFAWKHQDHPVQQKLKNRKGWTINGSGSNFLPSKQIGWFIFRPYIKCCNKGALASVSKVKQLQMTCNLIMHFNIETSVPIQPDHNEYQNYVRTNVDPMNRNSLSIIQRRSWKKHWSACRKHPWRAENTWNLEVDELQQLKTTTDSSPLRSRNKTKMRGSHQLHSRRLESLIRWIWISAEPAHVAINSLGWPCTCKIFWLYLRDCQGVWLTFWLAGAVIDWLGV